MSDVAPAELRTLLERERADLHQQLQEIGFGQDEGPSYDSNFADSSQVTAERGEAEALRAQLRETLDDVDRALAKMEEGTFGRCEECGEPIAPARLEAMPAARHCIEHASSSRR